MHRTRSAAWLAALLFFALASTWWGWLPSDDAVVAAPLTPVESVPTPAIAQAPTPRIAPTPKAPADATLFASEFKLVGTVKAANSAGSFALVRRTADSQLVKLRIGDRIEGFTVSKIESDSVVLAGLAYTVVIQAASKAVADSTAAAPRLTVPLPALSRPFLPSQEEPAWAGDPAPFGH
jgi:hypothetical protein